jgi:ketosteroid isomerase-like protein
MMVTVRDLSRASAAKVKAKDREGWIGLFADDAIVADPIGPSQWDPEGKGHHGKEAIARFYDIAIAPNEDVTFEIHHSYMCGDELANVVTLHIVGADKRMMLVPCVITYRKAADDRLAALRAFWEPGQIRFED